MIEKIRVAFVGGGEGSFIIPSAHKPAIMMDNNYEIVAGAFSSDPERAKKAAPDYRINPNRAYTSWLEMLDKEEDREDGADVIVVGTPNDLHVLVCLEAWKRGFHVVTDKPMSHCREEAQRLYDAVKTTTSTSDTKQNFAITHNYMRNAMAVMAAEMVRGNAIGEVHTIHANYTQGWLALKLENTNQKQAKWRTNPKTAGAGAVGDIGVHAFMQAIMMGNVVPKTISAHLGTVVQGRAIDDCGKATIVCQNGAVIHLYCSQVQHGHANNHWIEVCGSKGTLKWVQEDTDYLEHRVNNKPLMRYQRNAGDYMTPVAASLCRVPGGHPEAYLEGFANIYQQFATQIKYGNEQEGSLENAPGITDGMMGNVFIERCQTSSAEDGAWIEFDHDVFKN